MSRRGGARARRAKAARAAAAAAAPPPATNAARASSRLGFATMFACLPDDALQRIFAHLLGWEAARLMGVARAWRAWIRRDAVSWQRRFFRDFHAVVDVDAERRRRAESYDGLGAALQEADERLTEYENTGSHRTYKDVQAAFFPYELRRWEDETQCERPFSSTRARDLHLLRPRRTWFCYESAPEPPIYDPIDQMDYSFTIGCRTVLIKLMNLTIEELYDLHDEGMRLGDMHAILFRTAANEPVWEAPGGVTQYLRVDLSSEADESADWWLLYATAARKLLPGKCRVCNNRRICSPLSTEDEHRVLGVHMCALPNCQGQYPVMRRSAACDTLASTLRITRAKAQKMLAAAVCSRPGRTYRMRKRTRPPLVLRSSLDALLCAALDAVE